MAHRTAFKEKYLGIVMQAVLLCGTINISQVLGQSALLAAPAFGRPSGNMFVTYFGDTQNTSAIGAASTLPQCQGGQFGQSNLILTLENPNTRLVLQQLGPFTGITGFLWDTTAIATLTPPLTGSYVCRLYQISMGMAVATSLLSYQLNVVVPMNITCQYSPKLKNESLNVLSCTVIGYPLPSVTWSQVNGASTTTSSTLNGGIYQVTSTMSFLGHQTGLASGSFVTINTTAQYPPFNCTSLQNPSAQMNLCDSTPTSVKVSSGPLQIVENPCLSSPCLNPIAICNLTRDGNFMCACPPGTAGNASLPNGCVTMCSDHCDDKNAVCLESGGIRSCRCKAGYTGSAQTASSGVNINECLLSSCQDCLATCMDTEGSFQCLCPSGFQGNGVERGGCSRGPGNALSTGVIAGASCGTFFLGIIIGSLITWYLTRRKYGSNPSANSRDTRVGKSPIGMTMTNSDAYGMVDVPSTQQQQQPQYDYILPAAQ